VENKHVQKGKVNEIGGIFTDFIASSKQSGGALQTKTVDILHLVPFHW
jgi:hypothetical protein